MGGTAGKARHPGAGQARNPELLVKTKKGRQELLVKREHRGMRGMLKTLEMREVQEMRELR